MNKSMILTSLRDEREAEYLYGTLSATESGRIGALFTALETESGRQARLWENALKKLNESPPVFRPGLRAKIVTLLIHRLGDRRLLPVLAAMKVRGLSIYRDAGGDMMAEGAAASLAVATDESWHRDSRGGGPLRAAVFGANDGLVSNAGLILGVAGAAGDPHIVLLAGAAGLLFGAGPPALGASLMLTTLTLMILGGCMSLFTGRKFWYSALRMMTIGLAPAAPPTAWDGFSTWPSPEGRRNRCDA